MFNPKYALLPAKCNARKSRVFSKWIPTMERITSMFIKEDIFSGWDDFKSIFKTDFIESEVQIFGFFWTLSRSFFSLDCSSWIIAFFFWKMIYELLNAKRTHLLTKQTACTRTNKSNRQRNWPELMFADIVESCHQHSFQFVQYRSLLNLIRAINKSDHFVCLRAMHAVNESCKTYGKRTGSSWRLKLSSFPFNFRSFHFNQLGQLRLLHEIAAIILDFVATAFFKITIHTNVVTMLKTPLMQFLLFRSTTACSTAVWLKDGDTYRPNFQKLFQFNCHDS